MTDHNHDTLRRIFDLAINAPASERDALLARECRHDLPMRRRIEAMIAAAEDDRFLSTPTASLSSAQGDLPTIPYPADAGIQDVVRAVIGEGPGTQIGPYKLLELIGEGGFGSVFMAEQRSSVVRMVALKIIKLGMDTRQVIARFEQERQVLAIMDHPNIARVLDAGATETGRPYFVMELVKGDPIVQYCDNNNLSIHDRLELFSQVCNAVQHAHTKGVIHRDIKPSNILVSTQDGKPHARVIDFGIAKATASKMTERTLFTEHRQLVGTPEYMSPEQAEGSIDIDTRTDVYSLGVLLYELLTGTTPFSGKDLRSAAFAEIQRIIREVEPPRPSTRLTSNTATISHIAAKRQTEPRRLGTIVRGELDWIVMRALEKDRKRRYETANALALDIRRYLQGEAVVAAPASTTYRLRKFVRRNRAAVAAASAVTAALLIGVIAFAWQASVARAQRDRAVLAENIAQQRADELQKVSDFQSQMLSEVDPAAAGLRLTLDVRDRFDASLVSAGVPEAERAVLSDSFANAWARLNATDTALQLIDSTIFTPALAEIDRQFADQPMVNAKLRAAIAERYLDLGLVERSWIVSQELVKILLDAVGKDHPETVNALILRAKLRAYRGDSVEAETELRSLLASHGEQLGSDHPSMLTAKSQLGVALSDQGRYVEAEAIFREVIEARRQALGDDHQLTLLSIASLAAVLRDQGLNAEAEPYEREALEGRRRLLGNDHYDTIESQRNIAVLLLNQGRLAEAEESNVRVLETARRVLGDLHPATLTIIGNLAATLSRNGKDEEAERLQRDMLTQTESVFGRDHPSTINAKSNLATFLIPQGRFEEAEPLCREALEARLRVFGRNHPATLVSYNVMGFLMQRQNRPADALPFLREALDISNAVYGEDHPDRLVLLINMGSLSTQLEHADDAENYFRDAIERVTRTLGEDHPYFMPPVQSLGDLLVREERFNDVIDLLSSAEPACRRATAIRDDGALARLLLNLGIARIATGDFPAAEANLTEAHILFLSGLGPTHRRVRQAADALVRLYTAWHIADPSSGHDAGVAVWTQKREEATPEQAPDPSP